MLRQAVKVPYYTWSRFQSKQKPEYCGNAVSGTEPASGNLILGGDFNVRQISNKKNRTMLGINSKPCWYGNDAAGPVMLDREVFRTCGQSARLQRPGGSDRLFQYISGLNPGRKYRLSFFVKLKGVHGNDNTPHAGFYIQLRFGTKLASTVFRPIRQAFHGDIRWTRLEYTFTVPEGTGEKSKPYLEFRLAKDAAGSVWIDHVEIIPAEE